MEEIFNNNEVIWVIIDDDKSECIEMADVLNKLGIKQENIFMFQPQKRSAFDAVKIESDVKPSFDYEGTCLTYDNYKPQIEWKEGKKLYEDIISNNPNNKFIFLIDLDYAGYTFCGFDILYLLRWSLSPCRYTIRFVSGMPRKFMYQFIKSEFESRFPVFGEGENWAFLSKDAFSQLTKHQLNQFGNFSNKDYKNENIPEFNNNVIILSQKKIESITIGTDTFEPYNNVLLLRNVAHLNKFVDEKKPKSVIIDLDMNNPDDNILEIQRISLNINPFDNHGFGVYFITEKKGLGNLNPIWKPLLHTEVNNKISIEINEMVSPIFWKYLMAIDLNYERKAIHDMRNAIRCQDPKETEEKLKSIYEEIERRHRLVMDVELQTLCDLIVAKGYKLSSTDLETTLEKIYWVLVGDDSKILKDKLVQLNTDAGKLKTYGFLNTDDIFESVVEESDVIKVLEESVCTNFVFLFVDLGDKRLKNIRKIIKDKEKGKQVTCRFLKCSEKTTINKHLKTEENRNCTGGFVYECLTKDMEILTPDRVSFIRQDIRNIKRSNLNPELHQYIDKREDGFLIDKDKTWIDKIVRNVSTNLLDISWGTNNKCVTEFNENFLNNRLCILKYFCENLCLVIKSQKRMPSTNGIEFIGETDKFCILKNRIIRGLITDKRFKKAIKEKSYEMLNNDLSFAELIANAKFRYINMLKDEELFNFIAAIDWHVFAVLYEDIRRRFLEDDSKKTVRDFLHSQYAFEVIQKQEEFKIKNDDVDSDDDGNKDVEKLLISIKSDSLFEYEKKYLRERFKDNDIVQAWLNSN